MGTPPWPVPGPGAFRAVAVGLAVLVVGTVLAWQVEGTAAFLRRAAVPLVLVAVRAGDDNGGPVKVLPRCPRGPCRPLHRRDGGLDVACAGRGRRRRHSALARTTPFVCLVFLVPAPLNAVEFGDDQFLTPKYFRRQRRYVATLPGLPGIAGPGMDAAQQHHPRSARHDRRLASGRPPGWSSPTAGSLDLIQTAMLPLQLGVVVGRSEAPAGLTCADYGSRPVDPSAVKNGRSTLRCEWRQVSQRGQARHAVAQRANAGSIVAATGLASILRDLVSSRRGRGRTISGSADNLFGQTPEDARMNHEWLFLPMQDSSDVLDDPAGCAADSPRTGISTSRRARS